MQRSSSHSDVHGSVGGGGGSEPRKRRPTASGHKLKRCASLPAQPKPLRRGDVVGDGASAAAQQTAAQASPSFGGAAPMLRDSSVESLGKRSF